MPLPCNFGLVRSGAGVSRLVSSASSPFHREDLQRWLRGPIPQIGLFQGAQETSVVDGAPDDEGLTFRESGQGEPKGEDCSIQVPLSVDVWLMDSTPTLYQGPRQNRSELDPGPADEKCLLSPARH
jgi:hypothetical protein